MRAILLILIVAIVALIAAMATGLIDIDQTRPARAPDIAATDNGVSARGGQPPAFKVETGSVAVGTKDTNVTLPTLQVKPAGDAGQPATQPGNESSGNQAAQ